MLKLSGAERHFLATAANHDTRVSPFEDDTYRTVTKHLMPVLLACYILSYIDRVNRGVCGCSSRIRNGTRSRIWLRPSLAARCDRTAIAWPSHQLLAMSTVEIV